MANIHLMQRDMEKGNHFSPLVLNLSFEYVVRNICVGKEGLKLKQCLFYVVDVNVQGKSVHSVKIYEV